MTKNSEKGIYCDHGYCVEEIKDIYNALYKLNPFLANVPILYSLKTLGDQRFSGVFRRYKIGTLARNELSFCFCFIYTFSSKVLFGFWRVNIKLFRNVISISTY